MAKKVTTNKIVTAKKKTIGGSLSGTVTTPDVITKDRYRVEYENPNGTQTHKMFDTEKEGTKFQQSLGGNRRGYYEEVGKTVSQGTTKPLEQRIASKQSPKQETTNKALNLTKEEQARINARGFDERGITDKVIGTVNTKDGQKKIYMQGSNKSYIVDKQGNKTYLKN
jgi:hypothetical protein